MKQLKVLKHKGKIQNPADIRRFFDNLPDGETYIEKRENDVTTEQHRYYRGVIVKQIMLDLRDKGYYEDPESVHRFLADMFLRDSKEVMGKLIFYTKSTADLKTKEMNEYCEHCKRWAAQKLGLYISD
jgi:hypothetical protein